MANKKPNHPHNFNFFTPPGKNDPFGNILAGLGNVAADYALKRFSVTMANLFGIRGNSVQDQINLNLSRARLEKQQAETIKLRILSEKESRMLDIKIREKELEIERGIRQLEKAEAEREKLAIPMNTTVIEGALEVIASPEGFGGAPNQPEDLVLWLDSFGGGKVILILGRRGSGKTSLAAKIGEYMMATHKMPIYWVGLPSTARSLLPSWIRLIDSPGQCPIGCLMIIDEAGIQYLSLAFNTDRNRFLRALLMICRQRHCSLVFAVQSSRDVDNSVVRQADTIIFKEPGLHQPDTERPDVRPLAKKASLAFKELPRDKRQEAAYVFDDDFEGFITSTVPSFWSEGLSHIYGDFDLAAMERQVEQGNELQQIMSQETKLLNDTEQDKKILELKRQGYGIERIAKTLGCTTYRVRKCLEGSG